MIASVYSHSVVWKPLVADNSSSWIVNCSFVLHTLHLPLVVLENLIPYILLDSRWQNDLQNIKGTCTYLSWVSLIVSSFKRKRSFNSPTEKCLSTSSSSSTTQLLSAFLWACRWKIFSSIVPVYKEKKNVENMKVIQWQMAASSLVARDRLF